MDVFCPAPFITLGRFRDPWREFLDLVERARRCREELDEVLAATRSADIRARRFRWRRPAGTADRRVPVRRRGEAAAARYHGRARGPPRRG